MGKPYKRDGSPYWWIWWRDADGKVRKESSKSLDRRVASTLLAVRESQAIKEAAGIVPRSVALADAVGEYLDAHPPPIWSPSWHRTVSLWFRSRLLPGLGGPDAPVSGVTRVRVADCRARWLGEGLQPATINRICSVGSGFYRWASDPDRRYAAANPFAGHSRFPEVRRNPPPLTRADLARFIDCIPNPTVRRAAVVALDTGLRLSEVRRVLPADVRGRELLVASSYTRGLTKNRRERWVMLTARAVDAIGPGFADLPKNLRKSVAKALRLAGLPHIRWHDLRHFALTHAANTGTQAHHLQGMAGHGSLSMTSRYLHPEAEGMRAYVESVDRECSHIGKEQCPAVGNGDAEAPPNGAKPEDLN